MTPSNLANAGPAARLCALVSCALLAPLVFDRALEYPLAIVAARWGGEPFLRRSLAVAVIPLAEEDGAPLVGGGSDVEGEEEGGWSEEVVQHGSGALEEYLRPMDRTSRCPFPTTKRAVVVEVELRDVQAAELSRHHQAIKDLGEGLVPVARSADGLLEAVELPGDWWVRGVQWHPENLIALPLQRALWDDFARAVRRS